MCEVWVEVFTVWNIDSMRGLVVVACQDVVCIVQTSWSESDLGEIRWPNTSVHVLGVVLRNVVRVDKVVDVPWSLVPLLEVILLVVMMAGGQREHIEHFLG